MAGKIQEVFDRIQESKKEQKKLRDMYKDALANSQKYQELSEKLKELKEKKKTLENDLKQEFQKEFEKLEILKAEIENDQQVLNDLALSKVSKGEEVRVEDQNNTSYEPIFSVKFKKRN